MEIPMLSLETRASVRDRFSFVDKVALVTGAAGQIGLMSAAGFAELGAHVVLTDIEAQRGAIEQAAETLTRQYGHACAGICADVTDPDSVAALMDEIEKRFGTLDVVHSNAGLAYPDDDGDMPAEVLDKTMRVNVRGMLIVNQAAAGMMRRHGHGGSIVNTASMSAHIVNRRRPRERYEVAYPASKAAVLHLTRALAADYMQFGIRVNSISPGYVYSSAHRNSTKDKLDWYIDCTPMGRFATAEEMTGAVLFLASPLASYVTGTDICVDGGYTIW